MGVTQVGSRVELFEQIRRDRRDEGSSIRELALHHGVHRRTVRQALASAVPPPRQAYPARARPAIDPWREVIDGWLVADQDVPRKQRHTARRIWQRLVAEHGAAMAEVTVSRYVAKRRLELGIVDREVVRLRFGLTDGQPRTLDQIGRIYGVTRERVRQIESKTMAKLRRSPHSQALHGYLD